MFKTPIARTILRAAIATAIAVLAALKSSIADGISGEEWVNMVEVAFLSAGAWLGVGALTPAEPFFGVGKKDETVEVPSPPATPVPPDA